MKGSRWVSICDAKEEKLSWPVLTYVKGRVSQQRKLVLDPLGKGVISALFCPQT